MLWGGRFAKDIDDSFLKFSTSIQFDINLLKYDIEISKAHAKMLGKCKIIELKEAEEIVKGLDPAASTNLRSSSTIFSSSMAMPSTGTIPVRLSQAICRKLESARGRIRRYTFRRRIIFNRTYRRCSSKAAFGAQP